MDLQRSARTGGLLVLLWPVVLAGYIGQATTALPEATHAGLTIDQWLHVIEIVVFGVLVRSILWVGGIIVGLRDAVRDLKTSTNQLSAKLDDHETRLRDVEHWDGHVDRRERERRTR